MLFNLPEYECSFYHLCIKNNNKLFQKWVNIEIININYGIVHIMYCNDTVFMLKSKYISVV